MNCLPNSTLHVLGHFGIFAAHCLHVIAHGGHDFSFAGEIVLFLPEPVAVSLTACHAGLNFEFFNF